MCQNLYFLSQKEYFRSIKNTGLSLFSKGDLIRLNLRFRVQTFADWFLRRFRVLLDSKERGPYFLSKRSSSLYATVNFEIYVFVRFLNTC